MIIALIYIFFSHWYNLQFALCVETSGKCIFKIFMKPITSLPYGCFGDVYNVPISYIILMTAFEFQLKSRRQNNCHDGS